MALWRSAEWDDYEWFRLADVKVAPARRSQGSRSSKTTKSGRPAPQTAAEAKADDDAGEAMGKWLVARLSAEPLWDDSAAHRVLLVDLDNLRATPVRLRARLTAVVHLAREADDAAFAGQAGAIRRSTPWLAEFADQAQAVPDGSDLADHALLDHAASVKAKPVQFLIVSNDGIFVQLAKRGRLALLSPGADAMSDRLNTVAHRVVDLAALEAEAAEERAKSQRVARRRTRAATG
jgi:hypothetical protein